MRLSLFYWFLKNEIYIPASVISKMIWGNKFQGNCYHWCLFWDWGLQAQKRALRLVSLLLGLQLPFPSWASTFESLSQGELGSHRLLKDTLYKGTFLLLLDFASNFWVGPSRLFRNGRMSVKVIVKHFGSISMQIRATEFKGIVPIQITLSRAEMNREPDLNHQALPIHRVCVCVCVMGEGLGHCRRQENSYLWNITVHFLRCRFEEW
jgi:hypothetical protein